MLELFSRFPALSSLPHVSLGEFPSPVQRLSLPGVRSAVWVKRDDLDAPAFGGNKVRALEFLLGDVRPGDVVLTLGGEGSTHVLATAVLARRLGAVPRAVHWRHEMNPIAHAAAARAHTLCEIVARSGNAMTGIARAYLARRRGVRWVPLGGTSPLGMLGHVNAGLELAAQIARGELPAPTRIVLPLGSGGTAAGLALGLAIAGVESIVVGARVAPRFATGRGRVLYLAARARHFIERHAGARVPRVRASRIEVVHDVYGGAYGRPLPAADDAAALAHEALGVRLDGTYSAKAFAAALALARRGEPRTLFWLTFDARWMQSDEGEG